MLTWTIPIHHTLEDMAGNQLMKVHPLTQMCPPYILEPVWSEGPILPDRLVDLMTQDNAEEESNVDEDDDNESDESDMDTDGSDYDSE